MRQDSRPRRGDEYPWSSARGAAATVSRPNSPACWFDRPYPRCETPRNSPACWFDRPDPRCETPRSTSALGFNDPTRCETPRCTSAQGFTDPAHSETPRCTSVQGFTDSRRSETHGCTSAQGFTDPAHSETPRCTSVQGFTDSRRSETPRCTSDTIGRPGSAVACHTVRFACPTPRPLTPCVADAPAAGIPTRWPIFPPFGQGPDVDDTRAHLGQDVKPRSVSARSKYPPERAPTPWGGGCQSPASSISVPTVDEVIPRNPTPEQDKNSAMMVVLPSAEQVQQDIGTIVKSGRPTIGASRRRAVRGTPGFQPDRETNKSPWPTSTWRPVSQMAINPDHLPGSGVRTAGLPSKWPRPVGAPHGGLRQYCQKPPQESISEDVLQEPAVESAEQIPLSEQTQCTSPPPCEAFPPSILLATLDELRREALSKKVPKGMPQDWEPSIGAHTVRHLINSRNIQGFPMHSGRTRKNAGRWMHERARTHVETLYAPRK